MGLRANIYRQGGGDTSNGGLSSRAEQVTIVNAPITAQSDPDEHAPAVMLVRGAYPGVARVVEAEWMDGGMNGGDWVERRDPDNVGPMFGGTYVACSDGRFRALVEEITGAPFYGAVPLHDRWETPAQYASYD